MPLRIIDPPVPAVRGRPGRLGALSTAAAARAHSPVRKQGSGWAAAEPSPRPPCAPWMATGPWVLVPSAPRPRFPGTRPGAVGLGYPGQKGGQLGPPLAPTHLTGIAAAAASHDRYQQGLHASTRPPAREVTPVLTAAPASLSDSHMR